MKTMPRTYTMILFSINRAQVFRQKINCCFLSEHFFDRNLSIECFKSYCGLLSRDKKDVKSWVNACTPPFINVILDKATKKSIYRLTQIFTNIVFMRRKTQKVGASKHDYKHTH